jgi:hypothetical protein
MKKPWLYDRIQSRSETKKRRDFESRRRRVERHLAFWLGHRYGSESIINRSQDEFERLERCETGGDFVRLYLEIADLSWPKPGGSDLPMRERWQLFRRWTTYCYPGGETKPDGERHRDLEQMRNLLESDPGVVTGVLP